MECLDIMCSNKKKKSNEYIVNATACFVVTGVTSIYTAKYSTHSEILIKDAEFNKKKIFIRDQVTQANHKHKHLQCRPQTSIPAVLKMRSVKQSQGT